MGEIRWYKRERRVPAELQAALAFAAAPDATDPDAAAVQRVLRQRFADLATNLEDLFKLKPARGRRSILTQLAQDELDRAIGALGARICAQDGLDRWPASVTAAEVLVRFSRQQWPTWRELSAPPAGTQADDLDCLADAVFRAAAGLQKQPPLTAQGIADVLARVGVPK